MSDAFRSLRLLTCLPLSFLIWALAEAAPVTCPPPGAVAIAPGVGGPGVCQPPPPLPCCPPPAYAPLLYVRIKAPSGARATFIQGPDVRALDTPVKVGLRPGYCYRFRLSEFEDYPRLAIWPTLEVVGTLALPAPLCAADHPLPLVFSQEDIQHALSGHFITKVIYLEHPDKASPVQTQSDQPLEMDLRPDQDPYTEAQLVGRPLLIVRFGERQADPQEVARCAVPGTVLLPGDHALGPPGAPPNLPFKCVPPYDPVLGPKPPEEECMHDGGDVGTPVGFSPRGELRGLDPTDTVAEYNDSCGKKRIAISNRICLCVPRFAVLRVEIAPLDYTNLTVPFRAAVATPPHAYRLQRHPSIEAEVRFPEVAQARERPVLVETGTGPIVIDQLQTPAIIIGEQQGHVVVGTLKQECHVPAAPLKLCKSADKKCAQIGDVVTFTLTYSNPGGQPITDVVVSDSLTARLEYVAGSQKSDRDAVFTMQPNEVGSQILRWQLRGTLQPGETGTVSFQVKIR